MTEIQQFENDIASIYNQHGKIKNFPAMNLLIKEFPKYATMEWGYRFRTAQQKAKEKGLIRNDGSKRLVAQHERSFGGEWGI